MRAAAGDAPTVQHAGAHSAARNLLACPPAQRTCTVSLASVYYTKGARHIQKWQWCTAAGAVRPGGRRWRAGRCAPCGAARSPRGCRAAALARCGRVVAFAGRKDSWGRGSGADAESNRSRRAP